MARDGDQFSGELNREHDVEFFLQLLKLIDLDNVIDCVGLVVVAVKIVPSFGVRIRGLRSGIAVRLVDLAKFAG